MLHPQKHRILHRSCVDLEQGIEPVYVACIFNEAFFGGNRVRDGFIAVEINHERIEIEGELSTVDGAAEAYLTVL